MIKSQGLADTMKVLNTASVMNPLVSIGFFSLNLGSSLVVTNSIFQRVSGSLAGLALVTDQSSFELSGAS